MPLKIKQGNQWKEIGPEISSTPPRNLIGSYTDYGPGAPIEKNVHEYYQNDTGKLIHVNITVGHADTVITNTPDADLAGNWGRIILYDGEINPSLEYYEQTGANPMFFPGYRRDSGDGNVQYRFCNLRAFIPPGWYYRVQYLAYIRFGFGFYEREMKYIFDPPAVVYTWAELKFDLQ